MPRQIGNVHNYRKMPAAPSDDRKEKRLAEKDATKSPARIGRPPIGKLTGVRFTPDVVAQIDAIVGSGNRAQFVRDAVAAELKKRA